MRPATECGSISNEEADRVAGTRPSRRFQLLAVALLVVGATAAIGTVRPAFSATILVGGACTVADAIHAANDNTPVGGCPAGQFGEDRIELEAGGMYMVGALPSITESLVLSGNGATLDGGGAGPVLHVTVFMVHVQDLFIRNGVAAGDGGGILVGHNSALVLERSTVSGNRAGRGGGISALGLFSTLNIIDSTITGNSSTGHAGGIFTNGTFNLTRSTISGNTAERSGGGAFTAGGTSVPPNRISGSTISGNRAVENGGGLWLGHQADVSNSTISGNRTTGTGFPEMGGGGIWGLHNVNLRQSTVTENMAALGPAGVFAGFNGANIAIQRAIVAGNSGSDCGAAPGAAVESFGFNLVGAGCPSNIAGDVVAAPGLAPLAVNPPGRTATHALFPGSAAIDAAGACVGTDQRGVTRPMGPACDIGAYEAEVSTTFIVTSPVDAVDAAPGDGICQTGAGECTLRAAVMEANALGGDDTIQFDTALHGVPIVLDIPAEDQCPPFGCFNEGNDAAGDLDIVQSLTITGNGPANTIIEGSATLNNQILEVVRVSGFQPITTSITGVTVRNGYNPSNAVGGIALNVGAELTVIADSVISDNNGSGIWVNFGGEIFLDRVTVTRNRAPRGAGLNARGSNTFLTITNSTFSDNEADDGAGGGFGGAMALSLAVRDEAQATISNSTLSGNSAAEGCAIYNDTGVMNVYDVTVADNCDPGSGSAALTAAPGGEGFGTIVLRNSIVASPAGVANCRILADSSSIGSFVSEGYNLSSDATCPLGAAGDVANTDPLLAALGDNGGPTETHLPLFGSPVVDTGTPLDCPATDQRGNARPTDGDGDGTASCDRGAVEVAAGPPPNGAPLAASDGYATSEDTNLVVDAAAGVLANDVDPDGDALTAVLVSAPANGALALAADGSFSYAPGANFNGNDGFTYQARDPDGALSGVTPVAIVVNPVNDAPIAAGDAYGIVADTTLVVGAPGVLANDSDLEGSALSAVLATAPLNGAVVLNPNGSFSYVPAGGFVGIDSFTYQASDGAAPSGPALVTVVVSGAPIVFISNNEAPIPGGIGSFTGFPTGPSLSGLAIAFPGTGGGGQAGLYAQVGNSPALRLADLATPIPGGSGTFTAMRDLALSAIPGDPCQEAAFIGDGEGGQQGLYAMSFGDASCGNSPVMLVDLGTSVPGGNGTFTAVSDLALSATPGDPCHEAAFIGEGLGGQQGLYAMSYGDPSCGNSPVMLVDLGTSIPGGTGTFTALSQPTLSAQPGGPCQEAAFIGDGAGGQQGVYAMSFGDVSCASSPVKLVDLVTPIPGGNGTFTAVRDLALSATPGDPCQEAAFIADGTGGQQGVYALSFGGGSCAPAPAAIADRSTSIPQGLGAFTGFEVVSTSGGHTAFLAAGSGGQKGIYLASTLTKIVDLSDTLTGAPLLDLRFDRAGLSGNRLGFSASFTDGSQAVFEATLDFGGTNEAPVAAADIYGADEDVLLTVAAPGVLGNDLDAESGPLTAALVSGPAFGSLALDADGSFQYLPAAEFNGVDSFTYRAADPDGAISNEATVTISIAPVNDPPLAIGDSYGTTQDTPLNVAAPGVLGNDSDIDGPALLALLESGPANGTLVFNANGSFTYTPNAGFSGTDSFSYRAGDGALTSAPAVVTIAVAPAPGGESWTETGSPGAARTSHTATLLPNGMVLVTGGHNATGVLRTAELYDPATGAFQATGQLLAARSGHTATLLENGMVLVAGGLGRWGFLKSAELYDPATGTWAQAGSLDASRWGHTATKLLDGKVLVAGGGSRRAEIYDPATGRWSGTGSTIVSRGGHSATLLANGTVLVAGGLNGLTVLKSAEIYDPSTGTWRATGSLGAAHALHTATSLPDGTVLVAGGLASNGAASKQTELYDPGTGTWRATGSFATARSLHTATLLPDGRVLAAGGFGSNLHLLNEAELFDPATGVWTATESLGTARGSHTETLLSDGSVLVVGGGILGLKSAELFGSH
jgi:hypothetical protein